MAKKTTRKPAQQWAGENRESGLDSMFESSREAARRVLNRDDITVGTPAEELCVGLPLPSLALRYGFQSTVFPLSRVTQIAGKKGSCKSSLLYEIYRWHMVFGGGCSHMENENKDAAVMRNSILEQNPLWMGRVTPIPTDSADGPQGWQRALTSQLQHYRGEMTKKGGPGRTIPIALGVDSLTATDIEMEIAETQKSGFASLGYARLANLITRFMRQGIVSGLRGWPFSVIATNHLKVGQDRMGHPTKRTPGGDSVDFMATFLIEMEFLKDIDLADYGGIRTRITWAKNSIGPSRKWIEAELIWWQQMLPNGGFLQHSAWDWDTAAIELLLSFETQRKGKATLFKDLMSIVDLHPKRSDKVVWSEVLGIPEDAPVPYRVAGQRLEARPDLLEQIHPRLFIAKNSAFKPGLDYLAMLEELKVSGAQESSLRYANRSDMPQLEADALDPIGALAPEDE